jgi:hypothetical protein
VEGSGQGIIKITFPGIYLEELRQTSKIFRIVGVLAENRTEHPPSTSQRGYCLSIFLRGKPKYAAGKNKSDVGHVWRVVAGFLSRRPGFSARSVYVGFVADKVTLEWRFP